MTHVRTHLLLGTAAAVIALSPRGATAQGAPATIPGRMWAAQVDAGTIRLAWDELAGWNEYSIACEAGTRNQPPVQVVTVGKVRAKDANEPPRRLSALVRTAGAGVEHRCFLEWRNAPKVAYSARLPFNVVTSVAAGGARPVAPARPTLRVTGPGEITLSWDAVPGATAYLIGRAVEPVGLRELCNFCPASTNYVDRHAQPGATYRYSLVAISPTGVSSRSVSEPIVMPKTANEIIARGDSATERTLPAPSRVTASVMGPGTVKLTWSGATNAAGYEVLRSVNGGNLQPLERVSPNPSGSSHEIADYVGSLLTSAAQVTVRYGVRAHDAAGNRTNAALSQVVTVTMKAPLAAGDDALVPSNLRATAPSADAVELTWTAPVGPVECRLERALSGGRPAVVAILAPGTKRHVDAAIGVAARRPQYQLTCGSAGSSRAPVRFPHPASPSYIADGAGASSAPGAPTNLRRGTISPDSVMLTWGPPTDPLRCTLQRSIGSGGFTPLRSLPLGAWQYVDTTKGLVAQRPRYQLSCGGSAKTAKGVEFPRS